MSGVATAVAASAVVGGAASYYGAQEQAEATKKAASKQAQAARLQAETQRDIFEQRKELQEPFRELGYAALPALQEQAMGQVPATVGMGPQQQQTFNRLQQMAGSPLSGVREEINEELAARGMSASTPGMQDLARGMSRERFNRLGQVYNLAQGARQNRFNRLGQLANIGQGAAAQTGQAAGQFAQGASQAYGRMGRAQAQNALRQGNIQAQMYGEIGAMPMNALQTYMMGKSSGVF
jgi:hypothetical protein